MSKRKRRHLSAEFKARVAREALENQKTIQQIAKDNDIAPTQVSTWKKELETRISEIFERKNATNEAAVDFKRKSAHLGYTTPWSNYDRSLNHEPKAA